MEVGKQENNQEVYLAGNEDDKGARQDGFDQDERNCTDIQMQSVPDTGRQETEDVSELYIWGNDYYGQLGVGCEKVIHNLPKICSFNIVVSDVSCGEEHTVFVQGDGGFVYAMGSNSEGRLGTGSPQTRICNVPTLVEAICNIRKVVCGTSHTLALGEDGTVFSWGQAFYGALGITTVDQDNIDDSSPKKVQIENAYTPQQIPQRSFNDKRVKDIEAGSRHSIFVTEDNRVYGCGDANQGQLGLGENYKDRVMEPICIQTLVCKTIKQVACGKYHTMVLLDSTQNQRELWAFGANNFGQPVRIDPRQPEGKVTREKSHNFKQISAWHSSAAVTDDGLIYVWGAGIFGEFKKPRKVKLQNNILIESIQVGGSFIVLVDQDKRVVVWGSNSNGEIGVGDNKVRNHPTRLETIDEKQIQKVSVGSSFAFAIGCTSNKQENSIFNESAMHSHISAVRNSESKIADPNEFDASKHQMQDIADGDRERVPITKPHSRDHTINSLEEQLKQISLGTPSKTEQAIEDHSQMIRYENASAGKEHKHGLPVGSFTNPKDSMVQNTADNHAASYSNSFVQRKDKVVHEQDDLRVKQLNDQIASLKAMIEEKEEVIRQMNDQSNLKHEEYRKKLDQFKVIQDQELEMQKQMREENRYLREENNRLKDELMDLKRNKSDRKSYQPIKRYEPQSHQPVPSYAPPSQPYMQASGAQNQIEVRNSIDIQKSSLSPIPDRANRLMSIDDLKAQQQTIDAGLQESQNKYVALGQSQPTYQQSSEYRLSDSEHKRKQEIEEAGKKISEAAKRIEEMRKSDMQQTYIPQSSNQMNYQPNEKNPVIQVQELDRSGADFNRASSLNSNSQSQFQRTFENNRSADYPPVNRFDREQQQYQPTSNQTSHEQIQRPTSASNAYQKQPDSKYVPSVPQSYADEDTFRKTTQQQRDGVNNFRSDFGQQEFKSKQSYQTLGEKRMLSGRVESLRQGERQHSDLQARPQSSDGPHSMKEKLQGFYVPSRESHIDPKKYDDMTNKYQSFNPIAPKPPMPGLGQAAIQPLPRGIYEQNSKSPDARIKRSVTPNPNDSSYKENHFTASQTSQSHQRISYKPLYQTTKSIGGLIKNEESTQNGQDHQDQFKARYSNLSNKPYEQLNEQPQRTTSDLKQDNYADFKRQQQQRPEQQEFSSKRYDGGLSNNQYMTRNQEQTQDVINQNFNSVTGSENLEQYSQNKYAKYEPKENQASPTKSRKDFDMYSQDPRQEDKPQENYNRQRAPFEQQQAYNYQQPQQQQYQQQYSFTPNVLRASTNFEIGKGLEPNKQQVMSQEDKLKPSTQPSYSRHSDMNHRLYSENNSGRKLTNDVSSDSLQKIQGFNSQWDRSKTIFNSQNMASQGPSQTNEKVMGAYDKLRSQQQNQYERTGSETRSRSPLASINAQNANNGADEDLGKRQSYSASNQFSHHQHKNSSYERYQAQSMALGGPPAFKQSKPLSQTYQQQDSARKSTDDGGRGEDIRAKLARYKAERENFEQVRAQFRQKHKELEAKDGNTFQNLSSSSRVNTNPDANTKGLSQAEGRVSALSTKNGYDGSAQSRDYNSNIFAVDGSHQGFQNQILKGSPAFGASQHESQQSHDRQIGA